MTYDDLPRTHISLNLDLRSADPDSPDLLKLVICNDFACVAGLITETRSWLGRNFLNDPAPSDDDLQELLGDNFMQPTIEFVYPVEASGNKDIIVHLLEGTNVITVRSSMGGEGEHSLLPDGPLSVTLFSADRTSTSGMAYCHQHFDPNMDINDILKEVAWIVQNPQIRLRKMTDLPVKTISKTHRRGDTEPTTTSDKPNIAFRIKPRPGAAPGDNPDGELRFIFLCHLDREDGVSFTGDLLPCIKSSGAYVQPMVPNGPVSVDVDTIIFVDYAPSDPGFHTKSLKQG